MFRGKIPGLNTQGLLRLFSPASISNTLRLWSRFANLDNSISYRQTVSTKSKGSGSISENETMM